jgi:hypothetical protein
MTDKTETCRAVVERLVESGGGPLDAATEEHVGSCMACYRAMTDLREVPRVANALRAAAPEAPVDERFWEALAARTTDAAAAALAGQPAAPPRPARSPARRRARLVSFGGVALAAAASWLFMVRHPVGPQQAVAPAAAVALGAARLGGDEASGEALSDVAGLDEAGLRRLLARLGTHAPAALAGGVAEATDAADIPSDDEPRVSDEVAELDGDSLRRVATSLERAAL